MKKSGCDINTVSRLAGVSVSTVSRVLNNRTNVNGETREKVLRAMRELDYVPQQSATAIKTVSIIVEGIEFLYGAKSLLVSTLSIELCRRGYRPEVIPLEEAGLYFDGFTVAILAVVYSDEAMETIRRNAGRTPVIGINAVAESCHAVCANQQDGIRQALEYLADRGHRRIVMLLDNSHTFTSRERLKAFAAHHRGVENLGDWYAETLGSDSAIESVAKLLRRDPTAMIVCGEGIGIQAHYALTLLGKKIPDDISLIAFESPGITRFLTPPLTTINQNYHELAAMSGELIAGLEAEGDRSTPRICLRSCELIVRESVKDLCQ